MSDTPVRFAVVTRVPSPEAGEGGNMAAAMGLAQPVQGGGILDVRPAPPALQIGLRMPVFCIGEILILDPDGREPHGHGRRPDKWDVDIEFFVDVGAAVACARGIVFGDVQAYDRQTIQRIEERKGEKAGG